MGIFITKCCESFYLMIYFAEVSLTYMPTGPWGPSVPCFPAKP